jgi:putative phosphate transport regulator
MAKHKNDYFKLAEQQVEYCVKAAELLEEILCKYSAEELSAKRGKMHDIEHEADEIHHDILTRLSAEFITPIDQEDILSLIQIIDDVTDALDEVVLECYMFHINDLPSGVPEFSNIVCRCVKALHEAIKELKNFKKSKILRSLLVDINTIEGEADTAYAELIYSLFSKESETKKLVGNKAICESLEECCDLCEHAADIIYQIILKNT